MPTVQLLTIEDAHARREELLRNAGCTEDELRARSQAYMLDDRELAIFTELDGLDYLLSSAA